MSKEHLCFCLPSFAGGGAEKVFVTLMQVCMFEPIDRSKHSPQVCLNNETNHEMNNKIDNIDILMNNLSNSDIINSACTSTKEFVNSNFYNLKPFELQL